MDRNFEAAKAEYENACKSMSSMQRMKARLRAQLLKSLPSVVEIDSVDRLIIELLPHATRDLQSRFTETPKKKQSVPAVPRNRRGVRYDDATQERVLYALDVERLSVAEVIRREGVGRATINRWVREHASHLGSSPSTKSAASDSPSEASKKSPTAQGVRGDEDAGAATQTSGSG